MFTPKPENQVPKHFYALCYHWSHDNFSGIATGFVGFPDQNLTKPRIWEAKKVAHEKCPPEHMLFLHATYLGFMSQEQLDGPEAVKEGQDAPAPS